MQPEDSVLVAMVVVPLVLGALAWRLAARLHARACEPSVAAKLLLAAVATAFCSAVVLLSMELFYRFVHDATDSFALTKTSQRWFERHYQRNSWRLRDDVEYTLENVGGRRRVTFVGDSFTAGHGVREVGDRFANRIRAAHPELDVQVLARNGLDTGAQLNYLRGAFARGYRTDDLVLVYCPNDIGDLIPEWRAVVDALYADFRDAGPLVHHSYAVNHLYFRLHARLSPQLVGYFPRLEAAYAGPMWGTQARRLRELARLARDSGARLQVVTFPFLQTLGPDDPFEDAYARIAALWASIGVAHLDLRAAFAGEAPARLVVNPFDAHPSVRAHALAADAIGRFLASGMSTPGAAAARTERRSTADTLPTRRGYSAARKPPNHRA